MIAGNEFDNGEANGDVNGRILCRYDYDAFGNTISEEETIRNRYGFTGEMHDKQNGVACVSESGKYQVGDYQDIKGVEGLDAHHVGQKALMKKIVKGYDEQTAPSIYVSKLGHTKRHPERGIVSRSTKGITTARQLLARDLFELKRVYPDIPNSAFRELIDMNEKMYTGMG